MAKGKRKPSAKQLDRGIKRLAIELKKSGVISNRANLRHKYVSRHVVKKVEQYRWVLENNYKAKTVSKQMIAKAKEQGLETVGNKIIIPKGKAKSHLLDRGIVTGIRPIPGGNMEMIILPYETMTSFLRALAHGEVEKFRGPEDQFAFTLFGNMSLRAFRNSDDLYQWLIRYDSITNPLTGSLLSDLDRQYAGFVLYRVSPGAWNPPSYEERRAMRRQRRASNQDRRQEGVQGRKRKLIGELGADAQERRRNYDAMRKRQERAEMTPEQKAEASERAKERVRRSRQRKKDKRS